MYYVYILECEDGSLYTGITTDLERRFKEHQEGKGGAYTRAHKPIKIVFAEQHEDRSSASKREAEIKSFTRQQKINLTNRR